MRLTTIFEVNMTTLTKTNLKLDKDELEILQYCEEAIKDFIFDPVGDAELEKIRKAVAEMDDSNRLEGLYVDDLDHALDNFFDNKRAPSEIRSQVITVAFRKKYGS